jgi:hypothetical protein
VTSTLHPCSYPQCGALLKPHVLMCRAHWRRVPYPLRAEVWSAWEQYRCGQLAATDLAAVQDRATRAAVKGGAA